MGRDSSVGIATRYRLDGPGITIPVGGARFSAPFQTVPGAHPTSYTMGTGSFAVGRAAGAWCWPPIHHLRTEVEQRVELYLYSPCGTFRHVIGWPLPLPWVKNNISQLLLSFNKLKYHLSSHCGRDPVPRWYKAIWNRNKLDRKILPKIQKFGRITWKKIRGEKPHLSNIFTPCHRRLNTFQYKISRHVRWQTLFWSATVGTILVSENEKHESFLLKPRFNARGFKWALSPSVFSHYTEHW